MSQTRVQHADGPSDDVLVERCLSGQTHAFGTLVDRYQKVLFNLALRMVKDVQDAEDITQTVFLKAYENLDRYDPQFKFFSWIYRIAVNESLNFLKRQKSHEPLDTDYVSPVDSPAEVYERHEVSERVGTALLELEPEDRALILLKHIQDFSYQEIAFVFEIPVKTVKSRLYTARQRLKDVLVATGLTQQMRLP